MTDYSQNTDFSAKDALPSGDAGKVIKGSDFDSEFSEIQTAIATKANKISGGTTGNLTGQDANGDLQDSGYSVIDDDTMATASSTTLSTSESIIAWVPFVAMSSATTATASTSTTTIPLDDTIPTSSEGSEIITVSHTPASTTNKLIIEATIHCAINTNNVVPIIALFQDSGSSAIAASGVLDTGGTGALNKPVAGTLRHIMDAGTTSSTTFKIRVGPSNTATVTINGASGARVFGGVMISSLTVYEFTA